MARRAETAASLPKVLFVDDEQRVLNSMRVMFRRRFELFLASDGRTALEIVREHDIDVIVADHRMPAMTGVEVLTVVRTLSPRTVRILLTGYADLDAIEGAINDGEVCRFLTKPCAPAQLRAAIDLAVQVSSCGAQPTPAHNPTTDEHIARDILSQEPPAPQPDYPAAEMPSDLTRPMSERELAETDVIEHVELAEIMPIDGGYVECDAPPAVESGIIVFSADDTVIESVRRAAGNRFPVHVASNIVQVVKMLTEARPGVLITDITQDRHTVQAMTARLKQHVPELVTIIVSEHRDTLDMVWLINHGQIFRFLRKPVSPGRCAVSIQAALQHHDALRANPLLVSRHKVVHSEDSGVFSGVFEKLKSVRRLWV